MMQVSVGPTRRKAHWLHRIVLRRGSRDRNASKGFGNCIETTAKWPLNVIHATGYACRTTKQCSDSLKKPECQRRRTTKLKRGTIKSDL